jgi:hypothetical protein
MNPQRQSGAKAPATEQPGTPTPEDPREHEPLHDPPIDPEHDSSEGVKRL